ncbi:hypothetical protein ASD45_16320 [Pseudolabrys sp. Root1462]|uniref:DUF2336 domain-containing protein n=1 Tax=Pseudolabrys sp. Root1462 TaxID=1736466 RepID=UPI0007029763|nr:DUF2336 domain-containing protein [Pseudolabrys sp. Root1462]KQZ02249.1 hypothetical protein ASD45_16320 [Pseudolabrys sp. Root1462]
MSNNAFLTELEEALTNGPADKRAKTLRRVTDLFVFGASHFSEDHVAMFDGVFQNLMVNIETSARAALAERLKSVANAPTGVIRTLALDDDISVAGPVLTESERIDNASLVETARTKSQPHLMAISNRREIAETVTDVLVERGDRDVALNVARNKGARFSNIGYLRLVKRSEGDEELARTVGSRPEIPRQHFLRLLSTASKAVRISLQNAHPEIAAHVEAVVDRVAVDIQKQAAMSRDYTAARDLIENMKRSSNLSERDIDAFARAGKFEETAVALSVLGDLPFTLVERAMVLDRVEPILLVAKTMNMSWATARAILMLCAGRGGLGADTVESCRTIFNKMKPETAAQVIAFQRSRRQV